MAREIERKFLTRNATWHDGTPGVRMAQGYLSVDPARSVRIRLAGEQAWMTIKGLSEGISRDEFEYEIPAADARQLLGLCLPGIIDKTRHLVPFGGKTWEVDVFHGANEGLVVAEVELEDAAECPPLPPWVGQEVTDDPRYFNARLASEPYGEWEARS